MRRALPIIVAVMAVLALASCDRDEEPPATDPFTNSPTIATPSFSGGGTPGPPEASPTAPVVPSGQGPTSGAVDVSCVEGWTTPERDSPMFTDPLGVIRRTAPVTGAFRVVDIRMFTGPESPPSEGDDAKGYLQEVRRWYIKLYVPSDLSYQGRFLVEQRTFGRGVSAVAPYDSEGFASPDWSGFQFDSGRKIGRAYPGLPGRWSGIRYDFVNGGAGLSIPGLPEAVVGCLDGT